MKTCHVCSETKPDVDFTKRYGNRKWDRCKKCLYQYQALRWNYRKTQLILEIGGKCVDCGITGHPAIFDFHHRDPNAKEFSISSMRGASYDKLRTEISKCDLLCSCCHRLRHVNVDNWKGWENWELKPKKSEPSCGCGKALVGGWKFCSPECSSRAQERIDWPDDLPELVAASSKRAVAAMLGVSDKAVAKRLKRLTPMGLEPTIIQF